MYVLDFFFDLPKDIISEFTPRVATNRIHMTNIPTKGIVFSNK